jgi:hypothetical protein
MLFCYFYFKAGMAAVSCNRQIQERSAKSMSANNVRYINDL